MDSLSSLTAISNIYSAHSLVNRIDILLYTFSTIKITIIFIWVSTTEAFREMRKSMLPQKQSPTSSVSPRTSSSLEPTYPDSSANKPSNFILATSKVNIHRYARTNVSIKAG